MNIWLSMIIAGTINYITRLSSVLLINPKKLNKNTKILLSYVPSAVFPAIIFPAVFLNDYGDLVNYNDPKIFGALVAVVFGYYSKNIVITILAGLLSYWLFIYYI